MRSLLAASAAEARFGTFEIDETRFPNQHVEPEAFVQQTDEATLGSERGARAVAGFAEHHDPGVSDRCNKAFSTTSNPVAVRTCIDPDPVLLDPALQRITDQYL
jgi:hypothetical protein